MSAHEVVLLLETDPRRGLSGDEADRRRQRYGPNVLPTAGGPGVLRRILRQFHHPLIYVLLAATAVTAVLREYVDSAVIFAVVLINAVVGFVQESRAEAALDSLRSMVRTEARVLRDGQARSVPSEDLVPGDLIELEPGAKVPADLRIVRSDELRVDESALTGESVPVAKDEAELPEVTPVSDRRNMAYSGTLVTAGGGMGIAVATGARTELGQIHRLVGSAESLATPLTRKLAWFSKVLTIAILVLAAATFGVGLLRGQDAVEMFTAAVALAVGAIPEGLPAAVTITLAIGVTRMARRRAVIRRLPAIETLGSTTVVCSDKTGTLTENQMTVRAIWTLDAEYSVTGSGYAPEGELTDENRAATATASQSLERCLLAGAGCNDARLGREDGEWVLTGDPTEAAMLVVAAKGGLRQEDIASRYPRCATIPFSSERQYMATLHHDPDTNRYVGLVKGSVERIVSMSCAAMRADGSSGPLDGERILRAAEDLASRGLRVLATAVRPAEQASGFDEDSLPGTLVFTGLQAMLDPPRAAAAPAVEACHSAGIRVKMITGDHAATASAIATQLKVLEAGQPNRVLTGAELRGLPEGEFPDAVEEAAVFARVSPEQKLRLVEALQRRGHVVAVTGDGVNDAPALRQADIGVAMARAGTEVAKEAADMVLTDDDFATIEAAVEEGRGVFDNLTKFLVWTLPTNLGEGLVVLVAIVLGTTLPLLPTQILWINMTTAVFLGLMLAFEPKESGIMRRPPRDPARPLITRALMVRVLLVAALLVAGSSWLFHWEQQSGRSIAEARTAALNLFVVVEIFYLFSCRSLSQPVWRAGLLSNRWIVLGVVAQAAGQLAITYLPVMHRIFGTAPLSAGAWWRILAIGVVTAAVVAVDKRLRRHLM
ncbi:MULTISPECIES: HAD-IC family P-type ATPase [Micromonospora]|uniref:HAD family hydrolase n=1 Tax=Micromonospora solifontis TaxID=2487138 RepID=A0ABX9WAL5_9ACTN|nr:MULTISPECIES: HAD-IC family P-type ATPase [Micromonospora]NES12816.1 HAD-IC family P-type ATPase [Micromonospora sp. PPF5-17B]NES38922.1 HAD-IC family P-type ATPase [Micromonospora solifontis]NES54741.1 HAD-IC family P-type ATPase [Micromonospora sp. PPF5-6]RNL92591.1 HAD family hydrolase [Micromonospora solifontis]